MRIFQCQTRSSEAAARMPDDVGWRNPERLDERGSVPNHRRHAVILVAQRIIGETLTDLVKSDDLKTIGQRHEIEIPGMRTRCRIRAAEIPAIYKDNRLTMTGNVIRRPH